MLPFPLSPQFTATVVYTDETLHLVVWLNVVELSSRCKNWFHEEYPSDAFVDRFFVWCCRDCAVYL